MDLSSGHQGDLGFCMYCGSPDQLSDEHIIPLGMGGDLLFRKSSCNACAAKTSSDELKVLRGFMYEGRLVGKLPSRRKKKQPKTLERIFLRDNGTEFTKELLVENGVSTIHLPIFNEPELISGEPPSPGIDIREIGTLHIGHENYNDFLEKYCASGFKIKTDVDVASFCRVLSKIAYGYHVMQEGIFPRQQSPALSIMQKNENQLGRWIGSKDIEFRESNAMHLMQLFKLKSEEGGLAYIVAIKLFHRWGVNFSYLVTTRICADA